MARFLALVALLVAAVSGFSPAPAPLGLRAASTSTQLYGYVPQGLTEAEYKKKLAEQEAKSKANKAKFPKGKSFLDVGTWLNQLEGKQSFKGENFKGSGHTFAKQKFATKEEYDAAKKRK
mmetsp:Transcript_23794/g.94361  ORF Transcript_23794/g.94361 Transcript_23794/m.94361 type:complete len:120 (+) Transcript_23794:57-416(+)